MHGDFFDYGSWSGYVPAERCAEYLRKREPVFAQVREWCCQPAVERFDEAVALRAEVRRLRELVIRAAERLEAAGHSQLAKRLRNEGEGRGRRPASRAADLPVRDFRDDRVPISMGIASGASALD